MADIKSKEARSYNMSRIKGKNTKPEETILKYLFSQGFRYGLFRMKGSFAKDFDIPRLAELFAQCNPEQKNNMRGAFLGIYRPANIKAQMASDAEAITELLHLIEAGVEKQIDRIQKKQYEWLANNLADIAAKFL